METKKSAGILIYRFADVFPEYFLVHPGGPFWAKKDQGAWSIPKGLVNEGEDLLEAALRELQEETGITGIIPAIELTPLKQKTGKVIYAWAAESNFDELAFGSNLFEMEWPPRSGKIKSFPEIDRGGWFDYETSVRKLVPGQVPFVTELQAKLSARPAR